MVPVSSGDWVTVLVSSGDWVMVPVSSGDWVMMVLKHLQKCTVHCNSSKKFRNVLNMLNVVITSTKYNNLHVAGAGKPMPLFWNSLAVFFFFILRSSHFWLCDKNMTCNTRVNICYTQWMGTFCCCLFRFLPACFMLLVPWATDSQHRIL